jgi:hypothetical protein
MKVAWKIQAVILMLCIVPIGCKHAPTPAQKNLSDTCATSSLLALKAIQRDLYVPEVGSHTVSRVTQEKIDAVDVAAVAPEERAIASELNSIYADQLFRNRTADRLVHEEKLFTFGGESAGLKAEREETTREVDTFGMALDKCIYDFDLSLRARSLAVPSSCVLLPHMMQQLKEDWATLETRLQDEQEERNTANKTLAANKFKQQQQQRHQRSIELCNQLDDELRHTNQPTNDYQKERLELCGEVRSAKINDLGSHLLPGRPQQQ